MLIILAGIVFLSETNLYYSSNPNNSGKFQENVQKEKILEFENEEEIQNTARLF